ncbi:MAG: Cj0069 family protein [Actinomycetota bacterium]|nr:Cj0069 family protein [Actinomycetota bacterium]
MTTRDHRAPGRARVGVLWRGERGAQRPAEDRGLGRLFDAFGALGAEVVPVPFGEGRVEEVRAQLRELDGALAWVNPIQDGAHRGPVDELLAEAAASGLWVSAHPDVIRQMGTKEVLYRTRDLGWGSDTSLYRSAAELAERFPERLSRHGRLVLKQGRGNGGDGVWSVELAEPRTPATLRSPVQVRQARASDEGERVSLEELLRRCASYFAWSGVLVDQEYQPRLGEGLVRCYLSHDRVVGFCHQWPTGLLDVDPGAARPERASPVMEGPDAPAYRRLRERAEGEWVPEMMRVLGLDARSLPVVWDADFLYGPTDEHGDDSFVLCEINVSAVWPFPPMASTTIASNALARIEESTREGGRRPSPA